MFTHALDTFDDWRRNHSMELAMGGFVVAFILFLLWYGYDLNSPVRATENALRQATGDPTLKVGRPLIHREFDVHGYDRWRHRLICSRPGHAVTFAAIVYEHSSGGRRSRSYLSPVSGGDYVAALQTETLRDPVGGPDLLQACQQTAR